jgi:hypothetical protein
MSTGTRPRPPDQAELTSHEILQIAHEDAVRAYRDLGPFRIAMSQEADGWHVDYELKDPNMNGGGPHYVIDPISGQIVHKVYHQ